MREHIRRPPKSLTAHPVVGLLRVSAQKFVETTLGHPFRVGGTIVASIARASGRNQAADGTTAAPNVQGPLP